MRRLIHRLICVSCVLILPPAMAFETAEPAAAAITVDGSRLPPLPTPLPDGNPYRGNAAVAEVGREIFNQACARCHGVDAVSRNLPAPDLTKLDRACRRILDPAVKRLCLNDNDAYFLDSAQNGKVRVGVTHMPAWKDVLSVPQLWAIRSFLEK